MPLGMPGSIHQLDLPLSLRKCFLCPSHYAIHQSLYIFLRITCMQAHAHAIFTLRYSWPSNGTRIHAQGKEVRGEWTGMRCEDGDDGGQWRRG